MQRAIWLIPAQWFAWWAAFQCIAICVSLIALQAVAHALTEPGHKPFGVPLLIALPGVLVMIRWTTSAIRAWRRRRS